MTRSRSRREFIAAGLAVPIAAAEASADIAPSQGSASAEATLHGPSSAAPAAESPTIRKRKLGRTGLEVSEVGFGCMVTSDQSVIERAADLGVNLFDTARGYQGGNNERLLGAAIKGRRDKVVISTKTGARTQSAALAHLEESLRQLGTDHVDIWYLHGARTAESLSDDLVAALEAAKQQGKARFTGVSLHSGHAEVIPEVIARRLDVALLTHNFTMGDRNDALIRSLHEAGVGVVAMKVMAGGRDPEMRARRERLAASGGLLPALKWVLRSPYVHATIPSMTDMAQLDENLRAMSEPWTAADEKVLTARFERIRRDYCSMCGECEGSCPRGLPVADLLRFLTYAEGYGQFALGREQFGLLPPALREVRCGDCGSCPVRCPQGVLVARRLARAQEIFA